MRPSVALQQQWRECIDQEVAGRVRVHQQRIARLRTARARLAEAGAPPLPLVMLAHGDSWFDYPLAGNSLSLQDTDIIAQLRTMGNPNPIILNISHYGEASTVEMSWPKQERLIDALQDPANWMATGKPDAILFSGGGDDIAGNQFVIYLNSAPAASGLNLERFSLALRERKHRISICWRSATSMLATFQCSRIVMISRFPTVATLIVSDRG